MKFILTNNFQVLKVSQEEPRARGDCSNEYAAQKESCEGLLVIHWIKLKFSKPSKNFQKSPVILVLFVFSLNFTSKFTIKIFNANERSIIFSKKLLIGPFVGLNFFHQSKSSWKKTLEKKKREQLCIQLISYGLKGNSTSFYIVYQNQRKSCFQSKHFREK